MSCLGIRLQMSDGWLLLGFQIPLEATFLVNLFFQNLFVRQISYFLSYLLIVKNPNVLSFICSKINKKLFLQKAKNYYYYVSTHAIGDFQSKKNQKQYRAVKHPRLHYSSVTHLSFILNIWPNVTLLYLQIYIFTSIGFFLVALACLQAEWLILSLQRVLVCLYVDSKIFKVWASFSVFLSGFLRLTV